jgi:hypothetical protein
MSTARNGVRVTISILVGLAIVIICLFTLGDDQIGG